MNPEQLALVIDLFESKIKKLEEYYKENHIDNFEKLKMDKYINQKLNKEMKSLICFNLNPSIEILKIRKV